MQLAKQYEVNNMTQQQKLANEIYEWLLHTNEYNTQIAELKWVINLTLTDTALIIIQIWLDENEHIENLDDYLKTVGA